jgi:transcriptional regulator with XRE-family HTH domain
VEKYHEKFPRLDPDERVTLDQVAKELGVKAAHLRNVKCEAEKPGSLVTFPPYERIGHPTHGKLIFQVADVRTWDRAEWDKKERERQEERAKQGPIVSSGSRRFAKLNTVKARALAHAKELGRRKTTAEHLLLAVLDDLEAQAMLERRKVDVERLRSACLAAVSLRHEAVTTDEESKPYPSPELEGVVAFAQSYFSQVGFAYESKHQRGKDLKEIARKKGVRVEDRPGVGIEKIRAMASGKKQPDAEHILAALRLTDTPAAKLLEKHGVTKRSFREPLRYREHFKVIYPDDKAKEGGDANSA